MFDNPNTIIVVCMVGAGLWVLVVLAEQVHRILKNRRRE